MADPTSLPACADRGRARRRYVGADFIDVRCEAGDPKGGAYKAHWVAQKPSLGLPFGGNLPFLIDGETGVKLVQSNTILRFIGRKVRLPTWLHAHQNVPTFRAVVDCDWRRD